MARPFVSVVTPTYNRRRFLPLALDCYLGQTYPKDRMEWIILDDGTDCVRDLFESTIAPKVPNARYIRLEEKALIGKKRNILNAEAKGDIIISWDDDDFYHPERVSHAVYRLMSNPKIELAGSTMLYMYFFDTEEIYSVGPINPRHATNGTFAIRKSYAKTHLYDETVTHAEEKVFLEEYKHPLTQLDPMKIMLVMAHCNNTYDKRKMRDSGVPNPLLKKTKYKLKDFIKDVKLREKYANIRRQEVENPVHIPMLDREPNTIPADPVMAARERAIQDAIKKSGQTTGVIPLSAFTGVPVATAPVTEPATELADPTPKGDIEN